MSWAFVQLVSMRMPQSDATSINRWRDMQSSFSGLESAGRCSSPVWAAPERCAMGLALERDEIARALSEHVAVGVAIGKLSNGHGLSPSIRVMAALEAAIQVERQIGFGNGWPGQARP
jgi:hypothetical protein